MSSSIFNSPGEDFLEKNYFSFDSVKFCIISIILAIFFIYYLIFCFLETIVILVYWLMLALVVTVEV